MIQQGTDILVEHIKKRLKFDTNLKQITFLDSRVYEKDSKTYYPSVTTVLQYMPKNKFFENWIKDVGHNSDIIKRKAGNEGTQVHTAVESLINGERVEWLNDYGKANYSLQVWRMILKFVEFWKAAKPKVIHCEQFVYSDKHKYAGTADLIVEIDGEVWLLDVKTSNSLHKVHELQLAAYVVAYEELTGKKIDRTGIIWLKSSKRKASPKEGVLQGNGWELKPIDKIEENFDIFKTIYKLYALEHPVTKPTFNKYPVSISLED